jgi:hypothetical protein
MAMRQPRRGPRTRSWVELAHRASRRHRGARTDDAGIISRPAGNASHNPHNHIGRVIVHAECAELDAQCAELDALASLRS